MESCAYFPGILVPDGDEIYSPNRYKNPFRGMDSSRVRIVESFRAPTGIGQSLTLHHRHPSVLPSTIRLSSLSIFLSPLNTMSTVPAPDVADLRALSASSLTSGSAHRVRRAWVVKSLLSLLDLQSDQNAAESYPPPPRCRRRESRDSVSLVRPGIGQCQQCMQLQRVFPGSSIRLLSK